MNIENLRTVDGYPFTVLATGLSGDHPTAIFVEGHGVFSLDENNVCSAHPGMSVVSHPHNIVRYFNVYRAADGGIVMGSKAFNSEAERRNTSDSARALFGLRVAYNAATGRVEAQREN
ncbi:MAG: hypothetical protein DDT39_00023 [Firmicutes bacterium]|nr:hypothetical protein [candidate division NPL-UPA2 bacterium]